MALRKAEGFETLPSRLFRLETESRVLELRMYSGVRVWLPYLLIGEDGTVEGFSENTMFCSDMTE